MRTSLLAASLLALTALPASAQLEVSTGNVTVNVYYQGQPIPGACQLYFYSGAGSFDCSGGTRIDVPLGNYSLTDNYNLLPSIPITIFKGQTKIVNVEMSPYIGAVTGIILRNGVPPSANTAVAFDSSSERVNYGYVDDTGRFLFLAFPGQREGLAAGDFNAATFPFSAVANSTVDVGTIAVTPIVVTPSGSVAIRALYHGQPVTECFAIQFSEPILGSFGCSETRGGVATGSYTLAEANHPEITPIPFTITAGQTTTVDVELSPYLGAITGILLVNGAPPAANTAYAYADPPNSATYSYTDGTGRFRFLAFAGAATAGAYENVQLATFAFTAIAGSTFDVGTITGNTSPTGSVTVRALYKGQPVTNCFAIQFYEPNLGNFGCSDTRGGVALGGYTLAEANHPEITPIPFTISGGQTTVVDVELSPWVGELTGTIKLNGAPPPPDTVYSYADSPKTVSYSYSDTAGRFRFLTFAGTGTGTVGGPSGTLITYSFTAVAGQTRDLGGVGTTTLNGVLSAKSGTMPNRTWTVRLSNTGTLNAANTTQLTGLSLVQTLGAPCSPVVTSSFPIIAGFLAPGTNATVPVDINFTGCAANARFTATLTYNANGGAASGTRALTQQQP